MNASTLGLMRVATGLAASGSTYATINHTAPAVSASPVSTAHQRDSIANAVREMMSFGGHSEATASRVVGFDELASGQPEPARDARDRNISVDLIASDDA